MTSPELSKMALAQMLRTLADRVDSGADAFEVSMETENIGHATKTTIVLWGLRKPTAEDAERHRRMVHLTDVSRVCGICPVDQPHTCGVYRETGVPRADWCMKWRADIAPSKRCNTFLSANGTCPNEARHR